MSGVRAVFQPADIRSLRDLAYEDMRDAILSGVAAGVSFLFLQKAVFVLAAYPLLFAVAVLRRGLPARSALWWSGAFVLTLVPAAGWLVATGSWSDYVVSNWALNVDMGSFAN